MSRLAVLTYLVTEGKEDDPELLFCGPRVEALKVGKEKAQEDLPNAHIEVVEASKGRIYFSAGGGRSQQEGLERDRQRRAEEESTNQREAIEAQISELKTRLSRLDPVKEPPKKKAKTKE